MDITITKAQRDYSNVWTRRGLSVPVVKDGEAGTGMPEGVDV